MEMNKTEELEVAEQAAALVLRAASGDVEEGELPEFAARSPQHLKQLVYGFALQGDMREMGARLYGPRERVAARERALRDATRPGPITLIRIARIASVSIAAVVGLCLVASFALYQYYQQPYIAFPGQVRSLRLRDNSLMQLNGGSLASPDMSGNGRRITLWRGEALFDVEHDLLRPFYVMAGSAVLRAVGTTFDVKLLSAEATVTVKEGRVDVKKQCDSPLNAAPVDASGDDSAITLVAGESATISRDGCIRSVENRDAGEVDRQLAWTHQKLRFEAEPLGSAINQFNRYNRRRLWIKDDSIRDVLIRGGFDSRDIDLFVTMLKSRGVKAIGAEGRGDSGSDIILVASDCQWDGVQCTNR